MALSGEEEELGYIAADAALEIYAIFGFQGDYKHRGGTANTLWMDDTEETKELLREMKADVELKEREVYVPQQTGSAAAFPPTDGVTIEDTITIDNEVYDIKKAVVDGVRAQWKLTLNRRKARRLGSHD